jgi:tetratricopeptide (TPR) repeat protein
MAACLWVPAEVAGAHTRSPVEADAADARVQSHPGDAGVWLARSRLRLRRGDAPGALADLERAGELGAEPAGFALEHGLALLAVGRAQDAEERLRVFLEQQPRHVAARSSRARALVQLDRPEEAARELEHAIAWSEPDPDLYLSRARALLAADGGDPSRALACLEQARVELGGLVSLESYALDLEQRDRRFEAALARVERLLADSRRRETWLVRRATILEESGRPGEAAQSLRSALLEIERLPRHRRSVPAIARLEARARLSLVRLGAAR